MQNDRVFIRFKMILSESRVDQRQLMIHINRRFVHQLDWTITGWKPRFNRRLKAWLSFWRKRPKAHRIQAERCTLVPSMLDVTAPQTYWKWSL